MGALEMNLILASHGGEPILTATNSKTDCQKISGDTYPIGRHPHCI